MNRLILIGNGFDLAHGLKTSYHDFILDYLKECLKIAIKDDNDNNPSIYNDNNILGYNDELIDVYVSRKLKSFSTVKFSDEKITQVINNIINAKDVHNILDIIKDSIIIIRYKENGFSLALFNECITKNWVDIESIYYEELKKAYKSHADFKMGKTDDRQSIERLKLLNNQLDYLKEKLEAYLVKVQLSNKTIINGLSNIFSMSAFYAHEDFEKKTMVLNFNYTETPKQYLSSDMEIINIHGELGNNNNPIIFGYGDEVDKNYKEIEDLNENEFFKHIKSFDYFKTVNYRNLLRFIESTRFEVFILGHSCGLSDRTMLSTIFEDKNCYRIRIFDYRQDKHNYRNKTYEISRHFKDKAAMRRKIIPLEQSIPMPQYNG
ncbi:MAG TPA: AbiH family protein [Chitinophagales bacterium]|nr:AbiH family protein [Chitinophagales bacterium]